MLPVAEQALSKERTEYVEEILLCKCIAVHHRACKADTSALHESKDALEPIAQNNHNR